MKTLGIIPARGGSKGVPGKNIKLLGGKPLLQYTLESAQASKLLSKVVLSSDDPLIIGTAQELGLEAPFLRPAELAQDDTPSLDVILHALQFFKDQGELFDAVCLLQPTTPFRREGLLDEALEKFSREAQDSLVSVREVPAEYNPHWIFEEKDGQLKIATGDEEIIPRRQELPKAYHRDGAIYLTRSQVVLEQHSLYGKSIGYIDTTGNPYVNIDTPEDWHQAEEFLRKAKRSF